MSVTIESVIYLILVALLWGATNPLIKSGSKGIDTVKASSRWGQFGKEVFFLVTNLKYIVPFLINQLGSVLYFLTLQNTDLSLAVPVSNSLTFVFTAAAGWFLGEEKAHITPIARNNPKQIMKPYLNAGVFYFLLYLDTYIGMILILIGTTLCCFAKLETEDGLLK